MLSNNLTRSALLVLSLGAIMLFPSGCGKSSVETSPGSSASPVIEKLTLLFTYGSEKKAWVEAATAEFNASGEMLAGGRQINVEAIPMGSGDCVSEVLTEKRQAHLISPASAIFLKLGNADSQAATGKPLVKESVNLVLSPVVIAMWKPMAEKLGWPQKSLGWADIHALAADPQGWATHGAPQWGMFRFGHTHPDYSNSGLLSVLAEVSAATKKVRGLTLEDVANPATAAYLKQIESAVVHYGESTGFFAERMFAGGPEYLSAAVLYENMVVASRKGSGSAASADVVVAIYPKEGTFWSDHPAAVVNRPWVTPEHEEAAKKYISFLTGPKQQEKAMEFGFRPAEPSVALAAPIDLQHGVDPTQPQTLLEIPDTNVIARIRTLWAENKKTSAVTLVFDTSGSMKEEQKIVFARDGAKTFISLLGQADELSILAFSDQLFWVANRQKVGTDRLQLQNRIASFLPQGGTHLYDAISQAVERLKQSAAANQISAIVVLSDGADEGSRQPLTKLLEQIKGGGETKGVRVFTIAYGAGAKFDVLEKISQITGARAYRGDPKNIERVFREISTFF